MYILNDDLLLVSNNTLSYTGENTWDGPKETIMQSSVDHQKGVLKIRGVFIQYFPIPRARNTSSSEITITFPTSFNYSPNVYFNVMKRFIDDSSNIKIQSVNRGNFRIINHLLMSLNYPVFGDPNHEITEYGDSIAFLAIGK